MILVVALAAPGPAAAIEVDLVDAPPGGVVRGDTVKVHGSGITASEIELRLTQTAFDKSCTRDDRQFGSLPITFHGTSGTELTFLVPDSVPLGDYTVCAFFAGDQPAMKLSFPGRSGRLHVVRDPKVPVVVSSVYRSVNYVESEGPHKDMYHLVVVGDGFSTVGSDNKILLDQGREIPVCWPADGDCAGRANDCLASGQKSAIGCVASPQQIDLYLPQDLSGTEHLRIRVGAQTSANDVEVVLSWYAPWTPALAALAVFVLLGLLIWWLLGGTSSAYTVAGRKISMLSKLFLDPTTDTYSLSKAQFYLWTAAATFGYTYLTVARSFIQGHFEFAPVPSTLPGILFVSGATATVALGVNATKPKGAGSEQPSLADFITTGGEVAAERLQFLVWTVLGVLVFLTLILLADPASISDLPKIPQEFLYLMGVSSAGYLGGRFARKAGPVIDEIIATVSSLTLEIRGRNLSRDASFQIDGKDVSAEMLDRGLAGDHRPLVVTPDEQSGDANLAKVLKLRIATPRPSWLTRSSHDKNPQHTLSIVNPDGQRAEWPFSIPGPTAVLDAKAGDKHPDPGETPWKLLADEGGVAVVTLSAANSKTSGPPITRYEWYIDSDAPIAGAAPIERTLGPGLHRVTLKVIDQADHFDEQTLQIDVSVG